MSTVLLPMKRIVEPPPPEGVAPGVRPPPVVLPSADGAGEPFAVPVPDDGAGEPFAVPVPDDGVGEPAVFGSAAPSAILAWELVTVAAAAVPAWDDSPQPAAIASMIADAALANAKRPRGRGADISMLSFVHVGRSDDSQSAGRPKRLLDRTKKFRAPLALSADGCHTEGIACDGTNHHDWKLSESAITAAEQQLGRLPAKARIHDS